MWVCVNALGCSLLPMLVCSTGITVVYAHKLSVCHCCPIKGYTYTVNIWPTCLVNTPVNLFQTACTALVSMRLGVRCTLCFKVRLASSLTAVAVMQ